MTSTRYPGLTLRILAGARPAMGPGKAELLEHIESTGSISAAARAMGMSYRRAWQLVEAMNRDFAEPLVTTATGGTRGGGAQVTAPGRDALARFRKMELKASKAIAPDVEHFTVLLKPSGGQKRKIP
jgi:molybdate transport system regulatory protein